MTSGTARTRPNHPLTRTLARQSLYNKKQLDDIDHAVWKAIRSTQQAAAMKLRHRLQQVELSDLAAGLMESIAVELEQGDLSAEMDAVNAAEHRVLVTVNMLMEDFEVLRGLRDSHPR